MVQRSNLPWWVLPDVCAVLEIGNPSDAAKRLDEDEKHTLDNVEGIASRQVQTINLINESGLWSLVLTSRKPEAKAFKKWLTGTVIPSLRTNGGYIAGTDIRRDDVGRYCLNDCHRAAGDAATSRPGEWARTAQVADLVREIENAGNPAIPPLVLRTGRNGGTYAVKELVYAYAMWISPSFHLQVIRAFDGLVAGVIPAPVPALPRTFIFTGMVKEALLERNVSHQVVEADVSRSAVFCTLVIAAVAVYTVDHQNGPTSTAITPCVAGGQVYATTPASSLKCANHLAAAQQAAQAKEAENAIVQHAMAAKAEEDALEEAENQRLATARAAEQAHEDSQRQMTAQILFSDPYAPH